LKGRKSGKMTSIPTIIHHPRKKRGSMKEKRKGEAENPRNLSRNTCLRSRRKKRKRKWKSLKKGRKGVSRAKPLRWLSTEGGHETEERRKKEKKGKGGRGEPTAHVSSRTFSRFEFLAPRHAR